MLAEIGEVLAVDGTHAAELRFWRAAKVTPAGRWYRETGSGMGPMLNTASGINAHALTDHGTWLNVRNRGDLTILVEDDRLFNQRGVMLVRPQRLPPVKATDGQAFIGWPVSRERQAAIAAFTSDGEPLFFPNAAP